MRRSPGASFLQFVFVFVLFIAMSTIFTVLVGQYSKGQDLAEHAAAARSLMLGGGQ